LNYFLIRNSVLAVVLFYFIQITVVFSAESLEDINAIEDSALSDHLMLDDEDELDDDDDMLEEEVVGERGSITKKLLNFKHTYSLSPVVRDQKMAGININGIVDTRQQIDLKHDYVSEVELTLSKNTRYFFEHQVFFLQETTEKQYKESYGLNINEAYIHYDLGKHRFRTGFLQLSLGKVDLSPLDVLNRKGDGSIQIFSVNEEKQPLPVFSYQWQSRHQKIKGYFLPIKIDTMAEYFSRYRDQLVLLSDGEKQKNETFFRTYGGLQYELELSRIGVRLSLFHWQDPDADLQLKYTGTTDFGEENQLGAIKSLASNVLLGEDLLDNFSAQENSMDMATLELDVTLGSFVWKMDMGYFKNKNLFHIYHKVAETSADLTVTEIETFGVDQFRLASSIEWQYQGYFIMPVFNYFFIKHVPSFTHITLYENRSDPINRWRDLDRYTMTMVAGKRWDRLSVLLSAFGGFPVLQTGMSSQLEWKPRLSTSTWTLNFFSFQTEKQKMTDENFSLTQMTLEYSHEF
jgi:hypothetical protein